VWLSTWREQRRRKRAFIEKQVQEFYSPLVALLRQVRALCEVRRQAAERAWDELCHEAEERGGREALHRLNAERSIVLLALARDKDEQWKNEVLPRCKIMLQIFQEKIWLAEENTCALFQKLNVYVELWERGLKRAIPVEVIAWLNVREADIAPLYEDLEQTFQTLRAKLA
jgi:hypothetical protein